MTAASTSSSPEAFNTFGGLLRYLRMRAQLSQRDFAIAVGYSEAQISRLEKGQRRPGLDAVRARFLPALNLDQGSAWAARMLELVASHPPPQTSATQVAIPVAPSDQPAGVLDGLLATKLHRPQLRRGGIARIRLLAHLNAALTLPLTLVAAPAGFGKTTLLASWCSQLASSAEHGEWRSRVAWLSLDVGDNDPGLFLRYLVAALRDTAPSIGVRTLALLELPQLPPVSVVLMPLLNELAALSHDVVLALDDYHVISSQAVHDASAFLIERLPPQIHLVIASREDPPLPLSRLRARGQIVEIRAAQLRFTDHEVASFLRETMGLSLSGSELAAIEARTEGWAAGLQLAAVALQGQLDQTSFVTSFAGSNRFVIDYLAEEVLDRLPAYLRHFLLQTAILERLCGGLCDALLGLEATGSDNYSQLVLVELEKRNLFVVPLDHERRWYRYHHLFAEVLRQRLYTGTSPEQRAELYQRAATWCARHDLVAEAMRYAGEAGDQQQIVALIERHAERMLKHGEYATIESWLTHLPASTIRANPRLSIMRAAVFFITHNPEATRQCLADADQALADTSLAPDVRLLLRSEAAVLAAGLALNQGDNLRARELCQRALVGLPADYLRLRGETLLYNGLASAHLGDFATGTACFQESLRLSLAAGNFHNALFSLCAAAGLDRVRGHLSEAIRLYDQGIALAQQQGVEGMPIMGLLHADYAEVLYERNQLDAATEQAQAAVDNATLGRSLRFLALGYINQARLLAAAGRIGEADTLFRQADDLITQHQMASYYAVFLTSIYVPFLLYRRQLAAAVAWVRRHHLSVDDQLGYELELAHLALARVLLAQGAREQALGLLARLHAAAEAGARNAHLVLILAAQALGSMASGDVPQALEALRKALALAEPDGYIRSFVDEGPPMAALLREARAHGIFPAYCDRLLAAFPRP